MSATIPDGHTLDLALKANGQATYGTKAMKWACLQSGEKGKKKPGRKTNVIKSGEDKEQQKFFKSQLPGLLAMGIVDEDDQAVEVKRRWDAMKKARAKTDKGASKSPAKAAPAKAAPAATKGAEIRLDQPLDEEQLRSTGLTFIMIDKTGLKPMFVYTNDPTATKPTSTPTKRPS
eukprot:5935992-Prymnesium_polylepis.1